ncbi:cytochrome c biogenesis protein CcsA [Sulfuriroseicoccus oceanibius]|uniref:Cytochrome c biogenesis protein CcsA n=1 Tax=Sulfuriroseicoccus oceanibius TaxID=2707525 RepID=A0A6B3L919_9BACT|nr:cytochrome c biogenesis protein CcsA [Sulfuriroseicoccus oceanibius]QQL44336.1 cytochrome c biogenesis protein CcsA [Sulfuriroseicoccus oceanibius]
MTLDQIILLASTVLFAGHFMVVLRTVRADRPWDTKRGLLVVGIGCAVQLLLLWYRGEAHGRCPITNSGEVLVFLAWSMVVWYLLFGSSYRLSLLGMCTMPLVVLLQGVALVPGVYQPLPEERVETVNAVVELHAATAILGYGAFGLAAVASGMFVFQNWHLKRRRTSKAVFALPPITRLFDALIRLVTIGVVLLGASLSVSLLAMEQAGGVKAAIGWLVLGAFAILLVLRKVFHLSQKNVAWVVLLVFSLAAGTIGFMTS